MDHKVTGHGHSSLAMIQKITNTMWETQRQTSVSTPIALAIG